MITNYIILIAIGVCIILCFFHGDVLAIIGWAAAFCSYALFTLSEHARKEENDAS
jgi:uncharacterized membrane protein required for colicin V production